MIFELFLTVSETLLLSVLLCTVMRSENNLSGDFLAQSFIMA